MGKIIIVPNKLRINSDDMGWIVEEGKLLTADKYIKKDNVQVLTGKKGDIVWQVVKAGYCGYRVSALQTCIDWRCKELPDMMLKDFIIENIKFQKEITEALNGV